MPKIYLVGFMGVGKSTVGKKLAAALGYNFIDLDNLFENSYKISIDRFFSKYGEQLFRELENKLLISTFEMDDVVVSTGGGTPCYHNAMDKMNENGITVFLDMTESGIIHRLTRGKRKRPLVIGKKEEELNEFVHLRLKERLPFYQKANITIDALRINISELTLSINKQHE